MQAKMNFLLDRSLPFDSHKAQLLDELTYAIKNNTANVLGFGCRAKMQTKVGGNSRKTITFGTTQTKC